MAYICSKDPSHQSEDSDYCSNCGAKIAGAPSLLATPSAPLTGATPSIPAPPVAGASGACPDCGTMRTPGSRFCEVCRYDFERQTASSTAAPPPVAPQPIASVAAPMPLVAVEAPPLPPTPQAASANDALNSPVLMPIPSAPPTPVVDPAPVTVGSLLRWEAVVVVDPTLYTDPDPDIACPTNEPERTFPLDFAENLLGRRSDRKDIHPEIPVVDPGISHRHAKILRQPDGSFVLLDVGSTNGTRLNDVEVLPGVRTPLRDGDQITVGCWTRITIRSHT